MLATLQFIWNHPISSRHRAAAYLRYASWQLSTLTRRRPRRVTFAGVAVLICERSMTGATGNIYCGLHEFVDMAFLLHVLRPGDMFLDVGANVGSFTVLASKVAGARSVALEPVPRTYAALRRNVEANEIDPLVKTVCAAAGADERTLRFSADLDTTNRVVDAGYRGESVEVAVVTLDSLLSGQSPWLIKIDVEGFEEQVLEGSCRTMSDPHVQAVLVEGWSPSISLHMLEHGFQRASYDPFTRVVAASTDGRVHGAANHFWVRDLDVVRERCVNSRPFVVHDVPF